LAKILSSTLALRYKSSGCLLFFELFDLFAERCPAQYLFDAFREDLAAGFSGHRGLLDLQLIITASSNFH